MDNYEEVVKRYNKLTEIDKENLIFYYFIQNIYEVNPTFDEGEVVFLLEESIKMWYADPIERSLEYYSDFISKKYLEGKKKYE